MQRFLWLILFSTVLLFHAYVERAFILIYYTIWTFILEIIFFSLLILEKTNQRLINIRKHIFETIFAPSIVVFVGFWITIAPHYLHSSKPKNAMFVFVTHGCNALAMISEIKSIDVGAIWKPISYTIVYNLFLLVYVGAGYRSISGKLPYWYADYDSPIGWIFFCISVIAVGVTHFLSATYIWPTPLKATTQYIV